MSYLKRFYRTCTVLLIVSVCLSCISAQKRSLSLIKSKEYVNILDVCKGSTKKDIAICRGLAWLFENPVVIKEDGFLELGEELNLFYKLYLKSDDLEEKRFYRDYVIVRVNYLLKEHDLFVEHMGEITAYLNFAKIMKRLNIDRPKYFDFIVKDILPNKMTYPPNITYTILNSALIEDIGYTPRTSLKNLLGQGIVARFSKNPNLVPIDKAYASEDNIMNFFYDVTHEVFAVSNFGDRDPRRYLLDHEMLFLKEILEKGAEIYLEKGQVDILAEIVVCAKMLGYTDFDGFDKAVEFILNYQKDNGSFGVIDRMVYLGRPNVERHGVLVSLWALVE